MRKETSGKVTELKNINKITRKEWTAKRDFSNTVEFLTKNSLNDIMWWADWDRKHNRKHAGQNFF